MLKSYLKFAWRNIVNNRTSSFVNIAGLALGTTAFLFLLEYISLERGANTFHTNFRQINRLINLDPSNKASAETEPGWAGILQQRCPEIKQVCRFDEESGNTVISKKDQPNSSFSEVLTGYADGNFFSFFNFPLIAGQAETLNKPDVLFISGTTAVKYFGTLNPINQTLVVNNQFGKKIYTVGGVFADMKDNSDIRFNIIFSLETLKNPANLNGNDWAATDNLKSQYIQTYLLLDKNASITGLERKLTAIRTQLKADKDGVQFRLQSLADIHLGRSMNDNYPVSGNIKYIYLLGGIAVLILFIAWFNYINLSTANFFKRSNEVGVKKSLGASKYNLVFQFLGESLLLNLLSLIVAFLLVSFIQPLFNQLIGKHLDISSVMESHLWMYAILFFSTGAVLSGTYTAFGLAALKPVEILKGKLNKSQKGILLRKSLVVTQFAVSIILIISTILIHAQVRYMQNKKLGLNPSQLVVFRGPQVGEDSLLKVEKAGFKNELATQSFVGGYCTSGCIPSGHYNFDASGFTQALSKKGDELKSYSIGEISAAFFKTYEISMVNGRNFTDAECRVKWNDNNKIIMNETAARQMGFSTPGQALNAMVKWDQRELQVIGVVKDYNHTGAALAVDPIIFYPNNNSGYFTLKLTPDNLERKISKLGELFKANFSGNPFEFFFIDDNFKRLYASEKQYGYFFTAASFWAIFIACLGLFGLISFTVETRVKEIGVRKILGASITSIIVLISKDFLILIAVAFFIAVPVAWIGMNAWLENFAYRISPGWDVFAIAGFTTLLLAFATIGLRAVKAASANPVNSLRSE